MATERHTVTHPDLPGVEVQMAHPRNGWTTTDGSTAKPKRRRAAKKTARPKKTAAPDSPTAGPSTTTE